MKCLPCLAVWASSSTAQSRCQCRMTDPSTRAVTWVKQRYLTADSQHRGKFVNANCRAKPGYQVWNFALKNSLFPCETSADRNERGEHILIISQHVFFMKWGNWAQSTELQAQTHNQNWFCLLCTWRSRCITYINEQFCPSGKQYFQSQMLKEQKIEWLW